MSAALGRVVVDGRNNRYSPTEMRRNSTMTTTMNLTSPFVPMLCPSNMCSQQDGWTGTRSPEPSARRIMRRLKQDRRLQKSYFSYHAQDQQCDQEETSPDQGEIKKVVGPDHMGGVLVRRNKIGSHVVESVPIEPRVILIQEGKRQSQGNVRDRIYCRHHRPQV